MNVQDGKAIRDQPVRILLHRSGKSVTECHLHITESSIDTREKETNNDADALLEVKWESIVSDLTSRYSTNYKEIDGVKGKERVRVGGTEVSSLEKVKQVIGHSGFGFCCNELQCVMKT